MPHRCVLFTGPSGLNVRGALGKLADYSERQRGRRPAVVILDDLMIQQFLQEYPNEPMQERMRKPGGFQRLLLEPRHYLLELWRRVVEATVSSVSPEDDAFLFLHSVYYHTSSRDFFSCVDIGHLNRCLSEKGLEIGLVVTLIDDIYDVWRRLKEPGQLFDTTNDGVQAVCDLLLLLYWRSMEILASCRTATDLGRPHFLISLKHPLSVADDLIFSDKVPIYIAHPISEVRTLESGDSAEKAMARKLKEEIRQLKEAFGSSARVLPICPAGIDELIFEKDASGQLVPKLLPRWPFGDPLDLLFVPPRQETKEAFDLPMYMEPRSMALLLQHLADVIEAQINSRDRTLVEQTEAMVAWRPFYNGHFSSGVDNEIRHRNRLVELGLCARGKKPCFLLSRCEDLAWSRMEAVYDLLQESRATLPVQMTRTSLRNSLVCRRNELSTEKGALDWHELAKLVDAQSAIEFPLPRSDTGALRRLPSLAREEVHQTQWEAIAQKVNAFFPSPQTMDGDDVIYDDKITLREFVHRVEEKVSARRERGA